MGRPISDEVMTALSAAVDAQTGWHYPPERWADLRRGVEAAAAELDLGPADACAARLAAAPLTRQQVAVLARHLTVGETYFLRERATFDAFGRTVLPGLLADRRGRDQRLRFWSAGCCTGEEAYSIAACLVDAVPDLAGWDVTVLATDVNPQFLRRAAAGAYGEWSFRGTTPAFRAAHFTRIGGGGGAAAGEYRVRPALRRMVTFSDLNLVADAFPSALNNTAAMDAIFCRNVMIYMSAGQSHRLVERFVRCVVDGGWLIVGASEMSILSGCGLRTVDFPGARVGGERPEPSRPPEPTWVPPPMATPAKPATTTRVASAGVVPPVPAPVSATAAARARADAGDLAGALAACDRALAADKLDPHAHFLRAMVLQEQGRPDDAADALRRAVYLDPDLVMAHVALGHLARHRRGPRAARRHFAAARALLDRLPASHVLPDSEGLTAGRVRELIAAVADETEAS